MRRSLLLVASVASVASVAGGCNNTDRSAKTDKVAVVSDGSPADATKRTSKATPDDGSYSNIRAADYVGPKKCAECHQKKHAGWRDTLHRTMNQLATEAAVVGDFSGATLRYGAGHVVFGKRKDVFTMSYYRGRKLTRRYRVTRTIGTRYFQEYVGVLEHGPEQAENPLYDMEVRLPFGWWIQRGGWYHHYYYDTEFVKEYRRDGTLAFDPFAPNKEPWANRCIFCHNTYPYEVRLYNPTKFATGFDPRNLRLARSAVDRDVMRRMRRGTWTLDTKKFVTVGISCESCHFGGREHAINEKEMRFVPTSPQLEFRPGTKPDHVGARKNPKIINAICAQCHAANPNLFPNGAAMWNSNEAIDLAAGACATELRCIDCHDPHKRGPKGGLADAPERVAVCTTCHAKYRGSKAALGHSRHSKSARVNCLDCHMPRMTMGISHYTRSHRISSPTNAEMLARGSPNACNLCHLDKSIKWTTRELRRGWSSKLRVQKGWAKAYGGDLDRSMGKTWLRTERIFLPLVAVFAYAQSPLGKKELPTLLGMLDHKIPFYRTFSQMAIETIIGRRLRDTEYLATALPKVRAARVAELIRTLPTSQASP